MNVAVQANGTFDESLPHCGRCFAESLALLKLKVTFSILLQLSAPSKSIIECEFSFKLRESEDFTSN